MMCWPADAVFRRCLPPFIFAAAFHCRHAVDAAMFLPPPITLLRYCLLIAAAIRHSFDAAAFAMLSMLDDIFAPLIFSYALRCR